MQLGWQTSYFSLDFIDLILQFGDEGLALVKNGLFLSLIHISFEFVVESFICYPCDDKELSHKFTGLLKMYRNSLNPDQWKMFLAKPLFLPAVAKRIDALSC